jgi:hypothetical protein
MIDVAVSAFASTARRRAGPSGLYLRGSLILPAGPAVNLDHTIADENALQQLDRRRSA